MVYLEGQITMYNLEGCEMYGLKELEEPIQFMEPERPGFGALVLFHLFRGLEFLVHFVSHGLTFM